MKKLFLGLLTFVFLLYYIPTCYCAPYALIESLNHNQKNTNEVLNHINNMEYEEAMNLIISSNLDILTFNYKTKEFKRLIANFKNIYLNNIKNQIANNNYEEANLILNKYLSYYKNDKDVLKIKQKIDLHFETLNLILYTGNIEHLFTHCLLAFPEQALNPENPLSTNYDKDCLTPYEFKKILQNLYENDYVLIKFSECYEVKNGITLKKQLYLPKDKKPLVFSFDDVNYDTKKAGRGMVDKIFINSKGLPACYTSRRAMTDRITYDNEFITILESFILKNPSFSFKGARGLISLTGYDGILGYRTQKNNAKHALERKRATEVVNRLKELGWEFACHSYGHGHMKKQSDMDFAEEISLWKKEIEPIVGKTNVYVYPYGEWDILDDNNNITKKQQMLLDAGFKIFCGVGAKDFFGYIPFNSETSHTLLMDRKPVDGYSLRNLNSYYTHLFNADEIYDHITRNMPFN